jgi:hypothetical protein
MYKFKTSSGVLPEIPTKTFIRSSNDDVPPLTGWVHGKQASDIEERFSRAARNVGVEFQFKVYFDVLTSLPGESKEIDFVLDLPAKQTVDVDGEFAHKTNEQTGQDAMRDALLNNELTEMFYQVPHIRVPWFDLETQERADRTVRDIVDGRYRL